MMKLNKQYCLYLLKHNIRLIAVYAIILFTILTLFSFSFHLRINDHGLNAISHLREMSSYIGVGLSAITPIYFMHYLYQSNSCDMYFALPCKKENLWKEHMIFQYLVVALPLLLINLLTYALLIITGAQANIYYFTWLLLLLIMIFVQQAISSFACIKCNNIVDAIISSIAYLILPILLQLVIIYFLSGHINQAMLGTGYNVEELSCFNFILYGTSPLLSLIYKAKVDLPLPNDAIICNILWLALGIILTIYARKTIIKRRSEDSGTITKAFVIYPLMIFLVVYMMILNSTLFNNTFIFMGISTISAIIFIILLCFANRKIIIKGKYLLAFAIIYGSTLGFSYLFDTTHCFNQIKEIPFDNKDELEYARLEVINHYYRTGLEYNSTYSVDEGNYELIERIHKQSLDWIDKGYDGYKTINISTAINIRYNLKNGDEYHREYRLSLAVNDELAKLLRLDKYPN